MSILTFFATAFSYFSLETREVAEEKKGDDGEIMEKVTMVKLLSKFSISINILINFTVFINIGFMDATLEHHIRDVSIHFEQLKLQLKEQILGHNQVTCPVQCSTRNFFFLFPIANVLFS